MLRSTAGWMVLGCSTLAPKYESSAASANESLRHQPRLRNHARIGGQHAVHVGPDLNLRRIDAGADDRTRIIRPAAPERRRMPLAPWRRRTRRAPAPCRLRPASAPSRAAPRSSLSSADTPSYARSSVTMTRRASTHSPGRPALSSADAMMRELSSSPIDATTSSVRSDTSRSTASALTTAASWSNCSLMCGESVATSPRRASARAMAR